LRYRDRETERQRDRETERQRDRETERQRNRETEKQRDRETERQRDRETRETERQRDRETERRRDRGSIAARVILACITTTRAHKLTSGHPLGHQAPPVATAAGRAQVVASLSMRKELSEN
jgi:hypothetical protein